MNRSRHQRSQGKNRNICDFERIERTGIPEVVFAKGKEDLILVDAVRKLLMVNGRVLVTKCTPAQLTLLKRKFGRKVWKIDSTVGIVAIGHRHPSTARNPTAAVLAAGAGDFSVAGMLAFA